LVSLPRGLVRKHSITYRSYASCTGHFDPASGEIISSCPPPPPRPGDIGNIGSTHKSFKSPPIKHSKPKPSPRPPPSSGDTSGGCIAAGGEILTGSDCRRLGIAAGTHSHTVTAQGRHIQGPPPDVINTTMLPMQGGPSPTDAGCFAAGGEILTGARCDQLGIPRGTQSQTITAQCTDIRTGLPVMMGLAVDPSAITAKFEMEAEVRGSNYLLENRGQIVSYLRAKIADDQAFTKAVRALFGWADRGGLAAKLGRASINLEKATTIYFDGGTKAIRLTPALVDLGQAEVSSGGLLSPLSAFTKFFGTQVLNVQRGSGALRNIITGFHPSAIPGVGIGPILTPLFDPRNPPMVG
jgi:hypothetical protein